jgi:3-phosphoshikimate 1-carboxyvinyltransferase
MDTLTRAAAMEIRHLGLTAADRVYVPSPVAHQTGFLYGMWLALLLGAPQILQPVWDGEAALRVLRRWEGTFVQAATPFLADLVRAVDEDGGQPETLRIFVATGAAVPPGAGRTGDKDARGRGVRRLGHHRELLGHAISSR